MTEWTAEITPLAKDYSARVTGIITEAKFYKPTNLHMIYTTVKWLLAVNSWRLLSFHCFTGRI